jgi:hypothetical protein
MNEGFARPVADEVVKPTSFATADAFRRWLEALEKAGRMAPSGLEAFRARDPTRAGLYSFENRDQLVFDAAAQKRSRAKKKAWAFFEAQPPGYKRTAAFWAVSAKRDQTRERRLAQLMDASARGERLGMLSGNGTRRPKA